jgi:glutamyl-tRNA reductase
LIGLGSRSYGSAVRRHVRGHSRVAVIGTGILAQEILPFLVRDDRTIDLWGRRPECALTAPGLTYRQLSTRPRVIEEAAAIVAAAPISAAAIAELAARYMRPALLIDLRAEGEHDPPPIAPTITLADVFAEFDTVARQNEARVTAAKAAIARCASEFAGRARLNPSGWHDLCA